MLHLSGPTLVLHQPDPKKHQNCRENTFFFCHNLKPKTTDTTKTKQNSTKKNEEETHQKWKEGENHSHKKTKPKLTRETNKEGNTKHENKNFKYGEQKNQTAQNESKLDLRRGYQEICLKERSTNEDSKGATRIVQKTKRECDLKRGWWRQKIRNMESWKETQKKKKRQQKRETEKDFEKRAWGGGGRKEPKHLLNYRTQLWCITDRKTRHKNTRIPGKRRYLP